MMNFLWVTASELPLLKKKMMFQATERELVLLKFIADRFESQAICEKAVEVKEWKLSFVPDQYKM